MPTAAYLERIPESKRWGGELNVGKAAGIITDAIVSGAVTVTALKAAILSGAIGAQVPLAIRVNKALDRAVSMGQVLPNINAHGLANVSQLIGLGDGSALGRQGFFG